MPRTKRGTASRKRRKKILKQTKGYRGGRKSKYREAKQAVMKAWTYAYRDRRTKKREFKKLWQIRINAAVRKQGISYSRFISLLRKNSVGLDRKILAELAKENPEVFKKIVEQVKE